MENLKTVCFEEYDLTKKILELFDKTIELVDEFKRNDQNLLSSTAFAKINVSYRAAIELCNKYFAFDTYSITRSMFETLCILKCSCEDSTFATEYKNSFLKNREKIMKKVSNNKEFFSNEMSEFVTEERKSKLKKQIVELNAKDLSNVKNLADKANLTHLYLTFYAIASDYVHGSLSNFSNYIVYEGEKEFIDYKPTDSDIKEALLNANYMSLCAVKVYSKFMKLDIPDEFLKSLEEDIYKLFEKVNNEKYNN